MSKYQNNQLTDLAIRAAQAKDKKYKLVDGNGLYCEILVSGTKVWRYNYRFNGKQKTYTMGQYGKEAHQVSLSEARKRLSKAKSQLALRVDPSLKKQIAKRGLQEHTFQAIAETWLADKKPHWSNSNYIRTESYLRRDVYPLLGQRDIATIEALEIIPVITKVSKRGAVDAAKRVKGFIQQVFDYAVVYGKASRNPAKDINLQLILPKTTKTHSAAITDPIQLGDLLRATEHYHGSIIVKSALQLLLLVMLRPSELSEGEWQEIDLEQATWTIPAKRRKLLQHLKQANRPEDVHTVPLSQQALDILHQLHHYTGKGKYIFPSLRGNSRPISNNTIRAALRTMGFDNTVITTHGFRGTASTFLNTLGYRRDVIEAQLSHKDKNTIRSAYNHADYMQERETMLQEWADYLDTLRMGAKVIPIRSVS